MVASAALVEFDRSDLCKGTRQRTRAGPDTTDTDALIEDIEAGLLTSAKRRSRRTELVGQATIAAKAVEA
jgi:hypothetical protein